MGRFVAVLVFLFACGDNERPDVDPQPNGASCEFDEGCESSICLLDLGGEIEFPGGLCTSECDFEGNDCLGENETCLVYAPTDEHYCYQKCDDEGETCRDGYECFCVGSLCSLFGIGELVCLPV